MASVTPAELLDWLEGNQFLTPAQANELRPSLGNFPDNMALAKELIGRDWLTPFQVNQIMKGQQDGLILGGYRLRERIGEGAMGAVFKALNLRLGNVVAVKTLNKETIGSPKALDRFRREVQTAAQLNHPNIARVRDAEEIDGRPYLIMDFIDGMNLSQRVKKDGAMPIAEAVEYARQTALGLQHAFERGVIHRDIKPHNLVVTTAKHNGESRPVVKILDFGLARYESEEGARLTQVNHMLGTVDYVAPEQAQDARSVDIRADIYALGCTLFYLLTGKPPFPGDSVVEKLGPRVTGEAPWVRTNRPEVPPALENVLRTMMARRPEDRYQTPMEAAHALRPYANVAGPTLPDLELPATPPAPISMAAPVAVPTGVVMALPVAMPNANVPMALPVAMPNKARREAAVGRGVPAQAPRRASPAKALPIKLIAIIAGGGLVGILLLGGLLYLLFAGKPAKANGTLRIDAEKTKWSMGDGKAKPGHHHALLVFIKRVDFTGPVRVSLKGLPPGVFSSAVTMPGNAERIELPFTVSIGTDPLTKEVTLVAECEEAGARAELPMTLIVAGESSKLKK